MERQETPIGQSESGNEVFEPPGAKKRILVADDDPGIRDVFTIIFQKAGYDLELKEDGEDLLKNKFVLPDLFLIDKQLSGYDGLEICRYLKKRDQTRNIPVVIISASPNISYLARDAGADFFIEKPFDMKNLLKTIDTFINGKQ